MNKVIRFIQNYLIIGLPFVIIFTVLSAMNSQAISELNHYRIFQNIIGFGMMSWFLLLFIFLISLVLIPTARESSLKRLANLQERDERDEYITGKASRSAYISTLSVMIFILFLSIFSVSFYKIPKENSSDGHRYTLSIGFHYTIFNKDEKAKIPEGVALFDSKNLFPSTATIMFILLGWQLLVFNLAARKEQELN